MGDQQPKRKTRIGSPKVPAVWLGYLIPELVIPFIMAGAHTPVGEGDKAK